MLGTFHLMKGDGPRFGREPRRIAAALGDYVADVGLRIEHARREGHEPDGVPGVDRLRSHRERDPARGVESFAVVIETSAGLRVSFWRPAWL
jgi:hypothetical protein